MELNKKTVKYTPNKNKSTKITPEDHEFFRDYAHINKITLLESITRARILLENQTHNPQ